ncbi:Helix-turn-helix domain-containing protein [Thermomonospora echinospora]|uniref:Helix-turn-helix domain-containing protein n=1 Tax=Thermomonospora echinospora TaxID=1992 RepID=A0A1H6BW13_9ACTN|nr:helix-turn-helix domain-containing protein [Thermomonospora echinospora]SEG64898.1 Helix-turn-helix domain-containing protein [Thermomonospora echinospora]
MTRNGEEPTLDERVARLETRVAELESGHRSSRAGGPDLGADAFWALTGLKERADAPGMVLFTGSVTLPGGEQAEWQQGHPVDELLADDWSQAAAAVAALGHPIRLLLLREILHGARTVAELGAHERLGTTGQLYHHLRQLVAAGWLRTTARGQYAVPAERVVPLLVVLAAVRR